VRGLGGGGGPGAAHAETPGHPAGTAAAPDTPAGARSVVIDNFVYAPAELTVPAGATVTWVNRDDVPHTVTSTARPRKLDSGPLDTDQQFSAVFTEPGVYEYFCAVHPRMTGRVVVK